MSDTPLICEGEAYFTYPAAGKPLKTFYRTVGDLSPSSVPLIILHGGPGVGHVPYNILSDLTRSHGIPIVQYDQVGCGRSTHLQEKASAGAEFWNDELFIAQLESLIAFLGLSQFHVIGHSWGAMFGSRFAARRPKGLRKYIIWSSAGSLPLWEAEQVRLRATLPHDVQKALDRCEHEGRMDSEEYQYAIGIFRGRFLCRLNPVPADIMAGLRCWTEDPTVYGTMWGPSEFRLTGALKGWSVLDEIQHIDVPTLMINGRFDEAQDRGMKPFFDGIKKVKWVQFAESAHMAHFEERERFMQVIGDFLAP